MPEPSAHGDRRLWTWLVACLVGGALFAFMCGGSDDGAALVEFPLDDAWIHQVYARSLLNEGRLAYQPGVWESGFSSLAWVVALLPTQVVASWTDGWPVLGAKLTSMAFAVLAAVGAARLVGRLGTGRLVQGLAAVLTLLSPGFAFSAVSGMEPTLVAAALLWALSEQVAGRWWRAGMWFAAAVLARQEAAVVVGVAALASMLGRTSWRQRGLAAAATGGPAGLALGGWWALSFLTTGYALPNTFYVKASLGPVGERWSYLWHQVAVADGLGLWLVQCAAVGGGLWWAWRSRSARAGAWLVFASACLGVVAVAVSRPLIEPVLFYTQRYFYPFTALFVPLVALALEAVPTRRLASIVAAALVLMEAPALLSGRASYRWHCSDIRTLHTTPALRARQLVPPGEAVGVEGAGASRYLMDRRVVDLVGLNDHTLAHARGDLRTFGCHLFTQDLRWLLIPGDMVGEMNALYELQPVEEFRVARWSVIDGREGRSVFLVRASARPAVAAACRLPAG